MTPEPDLAAWWREQADDIAIDRALGALHWHRVNDTGHVCDADTPTINPYPCKPM